jgi:hypothetical protein
MPFRAPLFALVLASAAAQSTCPGGNFLAARTVNLKPTPASHIDLVRQPDGSYTGFEAADAAPYQPLSTTSHFERQFATCFPHPIRFTPSAPPPIAPLGAGSQLQASMALGSANFFVATISADTYTLHFDVFDSQHRLLSETNFSNKVPTFEPFEVNDGFESLLLTDLNGDGKADLVAVFNTYVDIAEIQGGVWVFLGNGDGTFQAGKRQWLITNQTVSAAMSAAAGDVNGDGHPDLVFSGVGNLPITIALGNGDGTFNSQTLTVSTGFAPSASVSIADLNGDGKADLVFAFESTVAVALGNGDATFQTPTTYPIVPGVGPAPSLAPVAIGDLNGDGIPDIATASGTILFGDGKGAFPTRRDYAPSGSGSVMIADFDGDGIPDLIFGNGNATFLSGNALDPSATVMFGSGAGEFVGAPVSGVTSAANYGAFAVADFNGDGIPDLVVASPLSNTTFQLTTFVGKGNGQFTAGPTRTVAENSLLYGVAADFNHDGKLDVAFLNQGATQTEILIFSGNGDGSFTAPIFLAVPDKTINFMAAPDLNGDGIPDLIFTGTTTLYAWLGKGDGTFTPIFTIAVSSPSVAFGDFNGDGKPDIAFASAASTAVSVLLGKGDGTFKNAVTSALPTTAVGSPGQISAADFDCDGHLDLIVQLGAPGNGPQQIAVLSGKGDGTFPAIHLTSGSVFGVRVEDINGDRIPDLIASGTNGALVARLGNGDGTFQAESVINRLAYNFAVADLNRDGAPDVAVVAAWGIAAFLNLKPAPDHGRDRRPIH